MRVQHRTSSSLSFSARRTTPGPVTMVTAVTGDCGGPKVAQTLLPPPPPTTVIRADGDDDGDTTLYCVSLGNNKYARTSRTASSVTGGTGAEDAKEGKLCTAQ